MKTIVGFLSLVGLSIVILTCVQWVNVGYKLDRDINGWQLRASVSSSTEEMSADLTKVKIGMESYGMTSGQAAIIFKNPSRDEGLIYGNIKDYIAWADRFHTIDHNSDTYVQNLHDLRTAVQSLELHGFDFWLAHDGFTGYMFFWASLIAFFVFGIWWLMSY